MPDDAELKRLAEAAVVETIVAAAVRHGGRVWTLPRPARHHNVLWHIVAELGIKTCPAHGDDQGFVTSTGRYVMRRRAAHLAIAAGQIKATKWGDELFSEDLW